MIYYTVYVKNLNNGTGYINVSLADDQLFKDYMQMLDVNVKPCRTYDLAAPSDAPGKPGDACGRFMINLSEVTAMSIGAAAAKSAALPPGDQSGSHSRH